MRRRPTFRRFSSLFFATSIILLTPHNLKAQADVTAERTGGLSAYAMYSRIWPDIGPDTNIGSTFGVEYARYDVFRFVIPSLVLRGKVSSGGGTVNQNTWGGGVRFEHIIRNFRPYANFFVSKGTTHFVVHGVVTRDSYTSDDSIVYSPGFGVDYSVTSRWAARFDYQFEFWHLGSDSSFSPQVMSIGILYRFPYRRVNGRY